MNNENNEKIIKKVNAPLTIEQIKDFFENKNIFYEINYSLSQLKGAMLLTYISNLELPCDINLYGSSKEEIFILVKAYMDSKIMLESDFLKCFVAQLILDSKNIDSQFIFEQEVLPLVDRMSFISENQSLFDKWNSFISSSFYYYLTSVNEIEKNLEFKKVYPTIDDMNLFGLNIAHLFSVPGFLETYMSVPITHELKYFKAQFEEFMFKGKRFHHYFTHENNILASLFEGILLGDYTESEISRILSQDLKL